MSQVKINIPQMESNRTLINETAPSSLQGVFSSIIETEVFSSAASSSSNRSNQEPPYTYPFTIILTVVFSFSVLLNVLSIVSIFNARAFTPINLLISNLALADLTYSLGIPLFIVHICGRSWPFGLIGCQVFIFTEFFGIIVGIFSVSALAVERYFDVADKKKRANHLSSKFKVLIVVVYSVFTWLLAVVFSLPLIGSIKLTYSNNSYTCDSVWSDATVKIFFSLKFVLVYFLPYVVITISSVKLLIFLSKWNKKTNGLLFRKKNVKKSSNSNSEISLPGPAYQAIKNGSVHNKKATLVTESSVCASEDTAANNRQSLVDQYTSNLTMISSMSELKSVCTKHETIVYMSDQAMIVRSNGAVETEPVDLSNNKVALKAEKSKPNQTVRKSVKNTESVRRMTASNYTATVRQKASRLVLIIVVLFLLQWSPLCLFQLIMLYSSVSSRYLNLINLIVSTLSYSNTIANPVLYMLLTHNFRQYWRKTFSNNSVKRLFQTNVRQFINSRESSIQSSRSI